MTEVVEIYVSSLSRFRHLKFQVTFRYTHTHTCTPFYMFHLCMRIYAWYNSSLEKKTSFILNEWSFWPYVYMDYMFECMWAHTYKYIHTHLQTATGICTYTLTHTHLPHTDIVVFKFYRSSIPVSLIKLTISLYLSIVTSFSNTS